MTSFEAIVNLINSNTDREINLFNYRLEKILKTVATLVSARAVQSMSNPLRFDYDMQVILKEAGYYNLINEFINNSYDVNYKAIIDLFESTGLLATFSQEDLNSINALKSFDMEFFNDIGKKASLQLKKDLYKYSLSDLTTEDLILSIELSLADTELVKYSRTYAETSIANFNQSLIDLKSQGVTNEVYTYEGVRDKKTRYFCQCLLDDNKYYNKSDASKIKSDKRRQYNCRHLIVPHSLDFAESEGYTQGVFSC